MKGKKESRQRRAKRSRMKMRELGVNRLCVYRSSQHIYAQIIGPDGSKILASASTLEADLKASNSSNVEGAAVIGKAIAERAKKAGVESVAFDRSGFKYHGRVKALADAARESGLQF